MRITIRYSAQARQAVGQDSESLQLDGPTSVRELLIRLSERHSGLRRLVTNDSGKPHPSLLLFVGEEQVDSDSPRALADGEVISILPPIAGG